MEFNFKEIVLLATIFITGLSAGFFYAWQVSVIPGTKKITDGSYLEAMQLINRAVLNPAFFIIFFGALILLVWSTYLEYKAGISLTFWLTLGAAVVYLIGTFGITAIGNVPLNESLNVIQLNTLSVEELNATRTNYELPWNRLHLIRTIFSLISFGLLLLTFRS